jgi:Tfp pilus assembly protein PilX
MKKNIGSALLITILIIGTVGAIALALGRLTLSEIKISSSLSDSVISYYAAEGGLEDGLWRYRVNHDVEDPCLGRTSNPLNFTEPCSGDILENNSFVDQYNYDNNQDVQPNIAANLVPPANQRAYDLKVYFKQLDCVGFKNNDCNGSVDTNSNAYKLLPDQSKTFDVSNLQNPLSIKVQRATGSDWPSGINYWIEYKFYINDQINPVEVKINPADDGKIGSFSQTMTIGGITIPPNAIKLVVKLLTNEQVANKTGYVHFGISSAGDAIDSGFTYVDSTGYYGQTKRRLRMTIDRESGNILSLLDYALYAGGTGVPGSGNITP